MTMIRARLVLGLGPLICLLGLVSLGVLAGCDKAENAETKNQEAVSAGAGDGGTKTADTEKLPEARTIIAKHVEAAGGTEAATRVKTLYFKSTYTLDRQNQDGVSEVWWSDGRFFATEEVTGFGTARSGYDGDLVWSDDPSHGLRDLEGKEAEQWIVGGAVFILPNWERYFEGATTTGQRELEGRTVYDVAFTSKLGRITTYSFDVETGLAAGIAYEQILPEATIPVIVRLEDYRSITADGTGYKLPFKEVTDLQMAKMTKVYETIEVGAEVDEGRFKRPGADGAIPAKPAEAVDGN